MGFRVYRYKHSEEDFVGNFVDALQRLTMHWDALMQHVHYDAL